MDIDNTGGFNDLQMSVTITLIHENVQFVSMVQSLLGPLGTRSHMVGYINFINFLKLFSMDCYLTIRSPFMEKKRRVRSHSAIRPVY